MEHQFSGSDLGAKSFHGFDQKFLTKLHSIRDSIHQELRKMAQENEITILENPRENLVNIEEDDLLKHMEKVHGMDDQTDEANYKPDMDAMLDSLCQVEQSYGEKISPKVASSLMAILNKKFEKSQIEALNAKWKPPENARLFTVPRMPLDMWNGLFKSTRRYDASFQQIQQSISRALVCTAKLADVLYTTSKTIDRELVMELTQASVDITTNLGVAWKQINLRRRQGIKPNLKQEFAGICNADILPSEWLFGDDLEKQIKLSKETVSFLKPHDNSKGQRFHPYNKPHGSNQSNASKNNLNFRGPWKNKGGGNWQNRSQNHQQQSWLNHKNPTHNQKN